MMDARISDMLTCWQPTDSRNGHIMGRGRREGRERRIGKKGTDMKDTMGRHAELTEAAQLKLIAGIGAVQFTVGEKRLPERLQRDSKVYSIEIQEDMVLYRLVEHAIRLTIPQREGERAKVGHVLNRSCL